MKIGIFGGTFDPIHVGHIHLAEQFLRKTAVEEVWFMVTPQNPWKKDSHLSDDAYRYMLVSKAVEGKEGLVASDYEFHLDKPSYSYKTLRSLRTDFPEHEFTLLIGADNWVKFGNWAEHEEILAHHRVAVYPRTGYEINKDELPEGVQLVDMELYDVSSTEIRRRLKEGLSVDEMVPQEILGLIEQNYKT